MDEDPLVRLARVTRVEAHKRRNKLGHTEQVDSYLRKILDFFEGPNAKTRRGAYTGRMLVDPEGTGVLPSLPMGTGGGVAIQPRRGPAVRKTGQYLANPEGLTPTPIRPSDESVNLGIASRAASMGSAQEWRVRNAAFRQANDDYQQELATIRNGPEFQAYRKAYTGDLVEVGRYDEEFDVDDLFSQFLTEKKKRPRSVFERQDEILAKLGINPRG